MADREPVRRRPQQKLSRHNETLHSNVCLGTASEISLSRGQRSAGPKRGGRRWTNGKLRSSRGENHLLETSDFQLQADAQTFQLQAFFHSSANKVAAVENCFHRSEGGEDKYKHADYFQCLITNSCRKQKALIITSIN